MDKIINVGRGRVSVMIGRKINVAQYESVDITVGYSDDKHGGETIEECFDRVEEKTTEEFNKMMKKIGDGEVKGISKEKQKEIKNGGR